MRVVNFFIPTLFIAGCANNPDQLDMEDPPTDQELRTIRWVVDQADADEVAAQLAAGAVVADLYEQGYLTQVGTESYDLAVETEPNARVTSIMMGACVPFPIAAGELLEVQWTPLPSRYSLFDARVESTLPASVPVTFAYSVARGPWTQFAGYNIGTSWAHSQFWSGSNKPSFEAAMFNGSGTWTFGGGAGVGTSGVSANGSVSYTTSGSRTVRVCVRQG